MYGSSRKQAALAEGVTLQPHQERIRQQASEGPLRMLLLHGLGSGKTLSSIAGAETTGLPYTAIVPAALRENYRKEIDRWSDKSTPTDVMSYSGLATGKKPQYADSLVFDEAHRMRNPESAVARNAKELARNAKQVLLLSGSPLVNSPGDFAVPMSMLTGKDITPEEFEQRYVQKKKVQPSLLQRLMGVTPGDDYDIAHVDELKNMLAGHIDYHAAKSDVVPVTREDVPVEMSEQQTRLYQGMWQKLPWLTRWKLAKDFPLSSSELLKLKSFLSGPRQVSLSTLPFLKNKDPYKAYTHSPKLQKAMELLKTQLADPRSKALIFANFIDAGLSPYAAALEKEKIPHGLFHGGLSDAQRKQLVDDYNADKIRVALIGPSGTEGLSFRGTQLVQLLDPHFQAVRPRQAEGRALRYDSHFGLPEDLKNVKIQRFLSRLKPGLARRVMDRLLFRKSKSIEGTDDQLARLAARKDKLNQRFTDLLKEIGSRHELQKTADFPLAEFKPTGKPDTTGKPVARTSGSSSSVKPLSSDRREDVRYLPPPNSDAVPFSEVDSSLHLRGQLQEALEKNAPGKSGPHTYFSMLMDRIGIDDWNRRYNSDRAQERGRLERAGPGAASSAQDIDKALMRKHLPAVYSKTLANWRNDAKEVPGWLRSIGERKDRGVPVYDSALQGQVKRIGEKELIGEARGANFKQEVSPAKDEFKLPDKPLYPESMGDKLIRYGLPIGLGAGGLAAGYGLYKWLNRKKPKEEE